MVINILGIQTLDTTNKLEIVFIQGDFSFTGFIIFMVLGQIFPNILFHATFQWLKP